MPRLRRSLFQSPMRRPAGAAAFAAATALILALVAGGFATETAGWRQWLGGQHAALQRAFVGAHFVHFSAVLLLAWLDAAHALHRLEPPMLAGTASGSLASIAQLTIIFK